ncbi:MAG: metallophosphoesterase [Gemmatimonadota bacterium]|nr:metallophosphoesterase [Gemmatimonadota bacterium]
MPLILSRRQWLAGVAGAMGGVGFAASATAAVRRAFTVDPELVTVTRHHVGGSDPAAPVLRIVQLTDLHLDSVGAHEERVAAAVAAHRPDVIVFTGDSIDDDARVGVLGEFLELLDGGTRKFAVVGDGERAAGIDVRELGRVYATRGCELLINDVADLSVGGRRVLVTGLDDFVRGTADPARALVGSEPTPNHLLLAHSPAQRDAIRWERVTPAATARIADGPEVDLAPYRPQWMLSGHTHGGQVAPFGLAPFRPRGSGRYVSGWYRDAVPALYVSRGIGTSLIDARYRATPEVPVFEWALA